MEKKRIDRDHSTTRWTARLADAPPTHLAETGQLKMSNKTEKWGVGNRANAAAFATAIVEGRSVDLIQGEHPHSRSHDTDYARFKGRDSGGEIVGFRGHRRRWAVRVEEFNYLKESELSGDEVRRGCKAVISIDGAKIYSFGGRELLDVLALVPAKIRGLDQVLDGADLSRPETVVGRKVFHGRTPGVIESVFDDGRVAIRAEGCVFPVDPWDDDGDTDRQVVVEDVLAGSIWWHRD